MSKHIKTIPLCDVERVAIVRGQGRTLGQIKATLAHDLMMNGGFYDMDTGRPTGHLKVNGAVLAKNSETRWGYCWAGTDVSMRQVPNEAPNYLSGVELLTPWDGMSVPLSYGREVGGSRGRTALALVPMDGVPGRHALLLYCSGDGTRDAKTPERLREELHELGATTALMLDGGGSSQCDFGGGEVISSGRRVHNYICVWLKKGEDKPVEGKTVCMDPGHGPGCPNGAPDGSYKEDAFAYDMGQRVRPHLERCGINVVMTRDKDGYPGLTERAAVSNKAGADLLVSLHTNAEAAPGWGTASGLLIYTSAAGDSAGRNKAAKAVLARMREAGVALKGSGLLHEGYTVLVTASAPAILIEYGFHTNRGDVALLKSDAHRATLALATAKGICDYLGVAWVEEVVEGPEGPIRSNRETVKARFGLDEYTMDFLGAYKYGDTLLAKLAAGK